ncbi:MAG: BolA family transcriptional regulator [Burkholderiales bacterium]|nr:BolA family transcriptional regulator [Burkholderiales bacterium]
MVAPDYICQLIQAGLSCEKAEVRGDGRHFEALVVSQAFSGMSRVKRHQAVYATLGDRLDGGNIHALSIKAMTPEEWKHCQDARLGAPC